MRRMPVICLTLVMFITSLLFLSACVQTPKYDPNKPLHVTVTQRGSMGAFWWLRRPTVEKYDYAIQLDEEVIVPGHSFLFKVTKIADETITIVAEITDGAVIIEVDEYEKTTDIFEIEYGKPHKITTCVPDSSTEYKFELRSP